MSVQHLFLALLILAPSAPALADPAALAEELQARAQRRGDPQVIQAIQLLNRRGFVGEIQEAARRQGGGSALPGSEPYDPARFLEDVEARARDDFPGAGELQVQPPRDELVITLVRFSAPARYEGRVELFQGRAARVVAYGLSRRNGGIHLQTMSD